MTKGGHGGMKNEFERHNGGFNDIVNVVASFFCCSIGKLKRPLKRREQDKACMMNNH